MMGYGKWFGSGFGLEGNVEHLSSTKWDTINLLHVVHHY